MQPSASGATPLPIILGFDSVMLLLWSPLTGTVRQRFWFVALSKQTLCKCGCGGRHTLEPCWNVAKWCFDHMLRGCMATRRHDGGPWLASDRWRATRGGWSFPPRAAMLQFRGDWPWLSGALGLVSHAGGQFCFKCRTRKEDPWTDPSPHAAWRGTLVDHDS